MTVPTLATVVNLTRRHMEQEQKRRLDAERARERYLRHWTELARRLGVQLPKDFAFTRDNQSMARSSSRGRPRSRGPRR